MLRRILGSLLTATLLLGSVPTAFAAPPTEVPYQIVPTEGFEAATGDYAITRLDSSPDASATTAYWGRITARHSSAPGSNYGLWCAGTSATSTIDAWTIYNGEYMPASRGSLVFHVPELAGFYSSQMTFAYTMPSLAPSEVGAGAGLGYGWSADSNFHDIESYGELPKTFTNEWKTVTHDLTAGGQNLSGRQGWVKFRWWARTEYPASSEGITIDDVAFSGLKYGPVRNLTAVKSASSVLITWTKPAKSMTDSADDSRTMTYSVWRSPAGGNAWTEITPPARVAATSLTDTPPNPDTPYDYKVQAFDTLPGNYYGVLAPAVRSVSSQPAVWTSVTASKMTAAAGEPISFTYRVINSGGTSLTNVRIETGATMFGTLTYPGSLAAGAEWKTTLTKPLPSSISVTATGRGTYGGTVYSYSAVPLGISVTPMIGRIAGNDRLLTAVEVSKRAFPQAASLGAGKAVVVASAYGWADALPASSLAGSVGGPLILVAKESIPSGVQQELLRLKANGVTRAYVVGGSAVVGSGARKALAALGLTVVPVQGDNRYATAKAVGNQTRALRSGGSTGGTVFVATGLDFPDALAASSLASALRAPILLTTPAALPAATVQALQATNPSRVVICGGTSAVSAAVENRLKTMYPGKVVRQAGSGRYDTAKAIIDYGKALTGISSPRGIFIATGTNYPDALAGGVLAGIGLGQWTPLMLTSPTSLSKQAESFIVANRASLDWATVLGGPVSVSESVKVRAASLTK